MKVKQKKFKEYVAFCEKCNTSVAGSSESLLFMIKDIPCPICNSHTVIKEI
jgi:hypothetical protein